MCLKNKQKKPQAKPLQNKKPSTTPDYGSIGTVWGFASAQLLEVVALSTKDTASCYSGHSSSPLMKKIIYSHPRVHFCIFPIQVFC